MKVLHITESFGGGVTSAINSYVYNSSQYSHYLFAVSREADNTGEEGQGEFVDIQFSTRGVTAIRSLKIYLNSIKPDVIHVHSSVAGVVCRILPFIDKKKIVYTPHGFSFLRNDHPFLLKIYLAIEKLLATRAAVIAGCGREERSLANNFLDPSKTCELVNICDELPDFEVIRSEVSIPVIGMVGRISEQKGFEFFLSVAKLCKDKVHFKWIGGGSEENENLLRGSGIEVTGWIERCEVIGHLKGLDLYFHSAAWEGFPISVLEASKLDKPMVLREIGAFTQEGLPVVLDVEGAANEICSWANGEQAVLDRAGGISAVVSKWHSKENLQESLQSLYERF